MAVASSNARTGSSFDEFLKEEDMLGNAVGLALLRVFAWKIREAMKVKAITKVELATLVRAAEDVGYKLSLDLVA